MPLYADHRSQPALDALMVPNESVPGGLSRRRFLAGVGSAGVLAALGPRFLRSRPAGAQELAANNLVVFLLPGGNDGFATVQPTTDSVLDQLRPSLLVDRASLLPIDDGWGLHPALATVHSRFAMGQVAVIGGVGAAGSLSHFESMKHWMGGSAAPVSTATARTGWLGRWLDTLGPDDDHLLRAVSLTGGVPQLLVGRTTGGLGIGTGGGGDLLGSRRRDPVEAALHSLLEAWGVNGDPATGRGHAARVSGTAAALAQTVGSLYEPAPPVDSAAAQGTVAARLLNDGSLGCRTVFCSIGDFDHHTALVTSQARELGALDRAVEALFAVLDPSVADRTTVLVFSEFGRRPAANGGAGTEHGTAGYAFVIGPRVTGGLYGAHLDATRLDADGNPVATVRHVDVVGSIVGPWLGGDAEAVIGAPTADLGLFVPRPVTTTTSTSTTATTVPLSTTTTTAPPTTAPPTTAPPTTAPPTTATTLPPSTTATTAPATTPTTRPRRPRR